MILMKKCRGKNKGTRSFNASVVESNKVEIAQNERMHVFEAHSSEGNGPES